MQRTLENLERVDDILDELTKRLKPLEEQSRLPWHARLTRWLAYGLVRAMVGIAGYGQRHWNSREVRPKD